MARRTNPPLRLPLSVLGLLLFVTAAHATTPDRACSSAKNKTAGKYAACRANAGAKLAATGNNGTFQSSIGKCEAHLSKVWQKIEDKAGAAGAPCPVSQLTIKDNTDSYTNKVQELLAGFRFTDLGETVLDRQTGLEWEKKTSFDGQVNQFDPHDADNFYTWSTNDGSDVFSPFQRDGTLYFWFLWTFNNSTSADGDTTSGCFAGHCDWRIPTIAELKTIVDLSIPGCGSGSPCIDPALQPIPADGYSIYWSSTATTDPYANTAWYVSFGLGDSYTQTGTLVAYARAVRGGH